MKWKDTQVIQEKLRSASSTGMLSHCWVEVPRAARGSYMKQLVTFTNVSPQMMLGNKVQREWQTQAQEKPTGIMGGWSRSQQISEPLLPDLSVWNSCLWVRMAEGIVCCEHKLKESWCGLQANNLFLTACNSKFWKISCVRNWLSWKQNPCSCLFASK